MKTKDFDSLLSRITKDPGSKESLAAQAELDYYMLQITNKRNRIVTRFTIIVGVATVVQVVLSLIEYFAN